ncbi:MAG: hypothetical protein OHK0029_38420 [Armatimonadaceae bacterium]
MSRTVAGAAGTRQWQVSVPRLYENAALRTADTQIAGNTESTGDTSKPVLQFSSHTASVAALAQHPDLPGDLA